MCRSVSRMCLGALISAALLELTGLAACADSVLKGLLEQSPATSAMDLNQDGIVDVADLVLQASGVLTASFARPESAEFDRAIVHDVEVLFSSPFQGELVYSVTGSASPGVDYQELPGTLVADGTSARISVAIIKDFLYEEEEVVQIQLMPGDGYVVAEPSVHVLAIQDVKASFEASQWLVSEGSGTIELGVAFNYPYRGLLKYAVTGSATEGLDYAHPKEGVVPVDGRRATIPIVLTDDLEMEDSEFITVDLRLNFDVTDASEDYDLGVPSRGLVLINDNDTLWTGVMMTGTSEETFQMAVRTDGHTTEAALVSSLDPRSGNGFISAGTIPAGTWTATFAQLGRDSLELRFGPLPLGQVNLFGAVEFERYLTFTMDLRKSNHTIWNRNRLGEFTSTVRPVGPGKDFLRRVTKGPVLLIEGVSDLPFPEHEVIE